MDERLANTQDTPLILACFGGHLSTVTALLAHGAGLDLQRHNGATALHVAAQEGHQACVEVLLQGGADYSIPQRDGGRPIHRAALGNRTGVVRRLLDHGCSIDMVSYSDTGIGQHGIDESLGIDIRVLQTSQSLG